MGGRERTAEKVSSRNAAAFMLVFLDSPPSLGPATAVTVNKNVFQQITLILPAVMVTLCRKLAYGVTKA